MIEHFVDKDPRKNRPNARVSIDTLAKRFNTMTLSLNLTNKTILDLGSANAAFCYKVMECNSKSYTGVEIQDYYVKTSRELLSMYCDKIDHIIIEQDIHSFLSENTNKYDIIFACGILYGVLNLTDMLDKLFNSANEAIVIESVNPFGTVSRPIIDVVDMTMVNSKDITQPLKGVGMLPNFPALQKIASVYGFIGTHILLNQEDNFLYEYSKPESSRYIAVFTKSSTKSSSLENLIVAN